MKSRDLAILGATALALLLAGVAATMLRAKPDPLAPVEIIPAIDPAAIARVEIAAPGKDPVRLARKGSLEEWSVETSLGSRAVDPSKARSLFNGGDGKFEFVAPLSGRRLGDNPEAFPSGGFGKSAPLVTVLDAKGGTLFSLEVGRSIASGGGTLVRKPGKPDIYLLPYPLYDNFRRVERVEWRQQRCFPGLQVKDIAQFEVSTGQPPVRYRLYPTADGGWALEEEGKPAVTASKNKALRLGSSLVGLRADEFLPADPAFEARGSLLARGFDGKELARVTLGAVDTEKRTVVARIRDEAELVRFPIQSFFIPAPDALLPEEKKESP